MNLSDLSKVQDIAVKINDRSLKVLRILYLALGGGVIAFTAVIIILYYSNHGKTIGSTVTSGSLYHLLYMLPIFCIPQYLIVFFFPQLLFKKIFEQNKPYLLDKDKKIDIDRALVTMRTQKIILICLLEGCAFFGLVIIIVSIINLLIYSDSIYWLGIIPSLVLVLYIIKSLPTKESLAAEIYEKILLKLDK